MVQAALQAAPRFFEAGMECLAAGGRVGVALARCERVNFYISRRPPGGDHDLPGCPARMINKLVSGRRVLVSANNLKICPGKVDNTAGPLFEIGT
jgi:hypothetical protein